MALVKCKECGQQVSRKAAACPACGAPTKRESIGCGGAVVIVVGLFFVGMWLTRDNYETPRGAATQSAPAAASRPSEPADGKQWVVVRTTANVRRGPGTDHAVTRVIAEGERYRCFTPAASDTWVKCAEDEYIHRDLVDFTAATPASAGAAPRLSSEAEARMMRLRDEAITNVGWVAGNAYGHPIWPQIEGYVGKGGEYYDFFMRLAPSGLTDIEQQVQYAANLRRYEAGRKQGSSQSFSEAAASARIQRVLDIIEELKVIMRSR